jgi:cysteine desulfurase / selenocysteine lyase
MCAGHTPGSDPAMKEQTMSFSKWTADTPERAEAFPVTRHRIFLGHAGVAPLPKAAADAMRDYVAHSEADTQDADWVWDGVTAARKSLAALLGASPDEIALLGPTSLGLSLVAAGLPWDQGDEVVFHADDYPANVYPWRNLGGRGVVMRPLRPETPGRITWELVEAALTEHTRLVSLASCHFLTGYRVDLETIGRNLRARGILFCVDAIQTLGAFPLSVEHIDFLSADSHKWMLGPNGAGVFYVRREHHDLLRPGLMGSWNVVSPEFVAQEQIAFYPGARRYEPGMLNTPGIAGMNASVELLLGCGIANVAGRLLALRRLFLDGLRPLGYRLAIEEHDLSPDATDTERSGIITVSHPDRDMTATAARLREQGISVSLRKDRQEQAYIRLSPHFYISDNDVDRVVDALR